MIGGMIASTVLTLIVIPAVYALWRERQVLSAKRLASARAAVPSALAAGVTAPELEPVGGS